MTREEAEQHVQPFEMRDPEAALPLFRPRPELISHSEVLSSAKRRRLTPEQSNASHRSTFDPPRAQTPPDFRQQQAAFMQPFRDIQSQDPQRIREEPYRDTRPEKGIVSEWLPARPQIDERADSSRWPRPSERPRESTQSLATSRLHPDRARLIDSTPHSTNQPPERPRWPEPSQHAPPTSRGRSPSPNPISPVRTRRPAKSHQGYNGVSQDQSAEERFIVSDTPPQRPTVQRGGSLLERLTLDSPPGAAAGLPPPLRDRVELPTKRPGEDLHGLPPRPSLDVTQDAESTLDPRYRSRKRTTKAKRGRR